MPLDPGQARDLAAALGPYRRLMEQEVVPESQYYLLGRREIPERIEYLGNIIEHAAARTQARDHDHDQPPGAPSPSTRSNDKAAPRSIADPTDGALQQSALAGSGTWKDGVPLACPAPQKPSSPGQQTRTWAERTNHNARRRCT